MGRDHFLFFLPPLSFPPFFTFLSRPPLLLLFFEELLPDVLRGDPAAGEFLLRAAVPCPFLSFAHFLSSADTSLRVAG